MLYDSQLIGSGKNLNIQRGFIITSTSTSGTITGLMLNSLEPLAKWGLIGSAVASSGYLTERFTDSRYPWALNLVVSNVYNSKEVSASGTFNPGISATETTDYTKFLPFGNKDEALLSIALEVINGTYIPPKK